jgi:hypothetical protein
LQIGLREVATLEQQRRIHGFASAQAAQSERLSRALGLIPLP